MKKLWMIDVAPDLPSLKIPPSNHLEILGGNNIADYH
jgi:plasmid maintenance system killer protein